MKSTLIIASFVAAALSAPTTLSTQRRQAGGNFQTFTAALGGIAATPVEDSGNANRPFQVKGDTFVNIGAALARSCDQQFNACANAANGGDATLSVGDCSAQKSKVIPRQEVQHILTGFPAQCDSTIAASTAAATGGAQAGGNANNNADGIAGGNAQQANGSANNGNVANNNGNAAACNKKHKKRSAKKL